MTNLSRQYRVAANLCLAVLAVLLFPVGAVAADLISVPPATTTQSDAAPDPRRWPGFAAVGVTQPDGTVRLVCGAAMIGKRFALTSAQCVKAFDEVLAQACDKEALPPSQLVLFPGFTDLTRVSRAESYTAKQVKSYRRASCKAATKSNLAIIELDHAYSGPLTPVSLSPDTDPVSGSALVADLGPQASRPDKDFRGRDGIRLEAAANRLGESPLTLMSGEACTANGVASNAEGGQQLCASRPETFDGPAGDDSCDGQSGAPVMAFGGDGRPYQIAIASWQSASCDTDEELGVFTRTSAYGDWIRGEVKDVIAAKPAPNPIIAPKGAAAVTALEQRLAATTGRISVDLCDTKSGECGLLELTAGQIVSLKVTSLIPGRLILVDVDANAKARLVFPNALSKTLNRGTMAAGQSMSFPDETLPFRLKAQAPFGPSRVTAILVPLDADIDSILTQLDGASTWDAEAASDIVVGGLIEQIDKAASGGKFMPGWGMSAVGYEIAP